MISLVKRLLNIRIIRYGLVGGIGIPIQLLALFVFKHLLGGLPLTVDFSFAGHPYNVSLLYVLAWPCAFEVSTTINFVLNQLFTYHEQKIHGWTWVKRALSAQLTSLSANLLSFVVGLALVYGFGINDYVASATGTIVAFGYNYFISRKFVFRPTVSADTTSIVAASSVPVSGEVNAQAK